MVSLILVSFLAVAKVQVAVIDTGLSANSTVKLCEERKNFTESPSLADEIGHGTNISHIISDEAGGVSFCQYSMKVFTNQPTEKDSIDFTVSALRYVLDKKIMVVNYSAGGLIYDKTEAELIKKLLDSGVVIFTAAGNESLDLDKKCTYYPACYDSRLVVVGSTSEDGSISKFSNKGKIVDLWVKGENISGGGFTMSGTSQATARATGKYIKTILGRKVASNEKEMHSKLVEATAKQFSLDKYINSKVDDLKDYLPESVKPYLKYLVIGTETATKQKVEIKYEF